MARAGFSDDTQIESQAIAENAQTIILDFEVQPTDNTISNTSNTQAPPRNSTSAGD